MLSVNQPMERLVLFGTVFLGVFYVYIQSKTPLFKHSWPGGGFGAGMCIFFVSARAFFHLAKFFFDFAANHGGGYYCHRTNADYSHRRH